MNKIILATACALSLTTAPAMATEKAKKPKVMHVCKKADSAVNILACNIYRGARGGRQKGPAELDHEFLERQGALGARTSPPR